MGQSPSPPAVRWDRLNRSIVRCHKCPRLRQYCREVAARRRRAFQDWEYWGKPVPNFGDPAAPILLVGLAPAAHGANRTGRMFTGDRSGQWLFEALHRLGLANQPASVHREDGLRLRGCAITAVCHCAPPGNKPAADELDNCALWLRKTLDIVPARVLVALGGIAWRRLVGELKRRGWLAGRTPKFAHGQHVLLTGQRHLLGCYHPSQQNTFTGRLTMPMFLEVLGQACRLSGRGSRGAGS